MTAELVPRVGPEAFEGVRLKTPGIVVVGYLADWCPFCVSFAPVLDALGREGLEVLRADLTDEESPLWDRFRIEIVPSVLVFREGEEAFRVDGVAGQGLSTSDVATVRQAAERLRGGQGSRRQPRSPH